MVNPIYDGEKRLMSKTLVFIPAYRCAKQIVRVLAQFTKEVQQHVDTVLVVDNQSPDDTLQCAIDTAKTTFTDCEFIAWRNADNYGLGGSHKAAFKYAIEHDFDHLIVLHGDDQADIRDALPLLREGAHKNVDCLLGARFAPGSQLKGYSLIRTLGNRVYNLLFSLTTLNRIYDLGSGLNIYSLKTFKQAYYHTFPDNLTFNYVMLLASYNKKQKVAYFPISWREEDQASNVRMFRQAFTVLYFLGSYFFLRAGFLKRDMRAKAFEQYTGDIVYQQNAGANAGTNANTTANAS